MNKVAMAMAAGLVLAMASLHAQQARDNDTREDRSPQREDQVRKDNPQQRNDAARQEFPPVPQPGGVDVQPARPDPDDDGVNAAFMAELRKCNRMSGSLRAQCVEEAKRRHGQM